MRFRIVVYSLIAFLSFVLPWIPLPFQKPEALHSALGTHDSTLVRYGIVACFLVVSTILLICVPIIRIRKNAWNLKLLAEGLVILALPFACLFALFGINKIFPPFDTIVRLNQGREPSTFVNPYLGYRKFDCTSAGHKYDQVFMPGHLGANPAEFVVYAPRREDKAVEYRFGRKDGDWYLDHKDSVWDEELFECMRRA